MSKESPKEKMTAASAESRTHGNPLTHQPSVKSELPEGMKTPKDPGEHHMGGVKKGGSGNMRADMGAAVTHLERETERGKHTAEVGGHKMHHR